MNQTKQRPDEVAEDASGFLAFTSPGLERRNNGEKRRTPNGRAHKHAHKHKQTSVERKKKNLGGRWRVCHDGEERRGKQKMEMEIPEGRKRSRESRSRGTFAKENEIGLPAHLIECSLRGRCRGSEKVTL